MKKFIALIGVMAVAAPSIMAQDLLEYSTVSKKFVTIQRDF